jgi:hypothetical protein
MNSFSGVVALKNVFKYPAVMWKASVKEREEFNPAPILPAVR